jgi:hypothetical protein
LSPLDVGEDVREMSAADITLLAFTLCNSLRVLAYAPQIAKAAKDNGGAQAISFATWGLFLFANVSAVAYALINKEDWMMAAMFIGNAAGCTAILLIAAWKRAVHRGRSAEQTSHEAKPHCGNPAAETRRIWPSEHGRGRADSGVHLHLSN